MVKVFESFGFSTEQRLDDDVVIVHKDVGPRLAAG
jgi:hypothetical protein